MVLLAIVCFVGASQPLVSQTIDGPDRMQTLLRRLSEEADSFQKLAPQVTTQETLHQRTLSRPHFRPRIGEAARTAPEPRWQDRTVVSQYAYSSLDGHPQVLYELRQVISVDGKMIRNPGDALKFLAHAVQASDAKRLELSLKQLEKYGLRGAVTDLGQLLMLFTSASLEHFEFHPAGNQTIGGETMIGLTYRQIDGPERITVIEANGSSRKAQLRGEVWFHADNLVPARVTVKTEALSNQPAFQPGLANLPLPGAKDSDPAISSEAWVDYKRSDLGSLVPVKIEHTEYQFGRVSAVNKFTYGEFKTF